METEKLSEELPICSPFGLLDSGLDTHIHRKHSFTVKVPLYRLVQITIALPRVQAL